MEANEAELTVPEPLEVGDQGLEEDDLHRGVRGGVLALRQQGPQAWYRGQPVCSGAQWVPIEVLEDGYGHRIGL